MFEAQRRFLLLTDIDDSLYADQVGATDLRRLHLLCTNEFDVVYLTGRTCDETAALVAAGKIPRPRLAFSDLGITLMRDLVTCKNPLIRIGISPDDHKLIRAVARRCQSLELQVVRENRVSFIIKSADANMERTVVAMRQANADVHVSQKYVDALPRGVNKGTAADLVVSTCGNGYEGIVVIGDSENDLHIWRGYCVDNVTRFLVASDLRAAIRGNRQRLHVVARIEDLHGAILRALAIRGAVR